MTGGLGNDTYVVDVVGDAVSEGASAGTDEVQAGISFTLAANFENLTLTGGANINGTGNGVANVMAGNSGNNILNGQGGVNSMTGGAGNDTYVVDVAGDAVDGKRRRRHGDWCRARSPIRWRRRSRI